MIGSLRMSMGVEEEDAEAVGDVEEEEEGATRRRWRGTETASMRGQASRRGRAGRVEVDVPVEVDVNVPAHMSRSDSFTWWGCRSHFKSFVSLKPPDRTRPLDRINLCIR